MLERFFPPTGQGAWQLMLASLIGCGLLAVASSWMRRSRALPSPRLSLGLDAAILLILTDLSWFHVLSLQRATNPQYFAYGQDVRDYVGYILALLEPGFPAISPFRYPLFAWLGARLCELQTIPPALAAMKLSLWSSILLPPALYLLGRQLAPRAVALAGALFVLHLDPMMQTLGTPSDYIFCTLLQVLTLASGVWALRAGHPGRYALFGLASSLMLASTAKAFAVVLPALGMVGLALLLRRSQARRHNLLSFGLYLAPLVVVWLIFAQARLPAFSLEWQIFNVQNENRQQTDGRSLEVPPGLGWDLRSTSDQQGYWRVGDARALTHLPQVFRFLMAERPDLLPASVREESFRRGLRYIFALWDLTILLLTVPGILALGLFSQNPGQDPVGAARTEDIPRPTESTTSPEQAAEGPSLDPGPETSPLPCPTTPATLEAPDPIKPRGFRWLVAQLPAWKRAEWPHRWMAALFLGGITLGQVLGSVATLFRFRYVQPLAVTLPLLTFAGGAALFRAVSRPGHRHQELIWVPVLLTALWIQGPSRGPFGLANTIRIGVKANYALQPLQDLYALAPRLEPGAGLADLTDYRMSWYLFWGTQVPLVAAASPREDGSIAVDLAGSAWKRRFLVEECRDEWAANHSGPWRYVDAAFLENPERFQRVSPCIVEDLAPSKPFRVSPPGRPAERPRP